MLEVREDVKFVDFVDARDPLVLSLASHCVALQHAYVQIRAQHDRLKVL